MNRTTAQHSWRVFYVLGAAILFLASLSAKAAELTDVRIGVHEKYTRVVIETDAEAPYHIESSVGGEVVLDLAASSEPRAVSSSKSPHLESVLVKPAPSGGSEVRIALRVPVDVMLMVLSEPNRIVMDLVETTTEAAPTAAEPAAPVPEPKPVAEAPPEPAETIPQPKQATPAAEAKPLAEAPSEPAPAEPAKPVAGQEKKQPRRKASAAPAVPEPDPSAALSTGEPPGGRSLTRRKPARPPANLPRRGVEPAPPAAKGGFLAQLPAPFDRPLVLAGIGLGVIFVIAFALLRRRGSAEEEPITPFAAGEPFSADEQPALAAEPEVAEEPEEAEAAAEISADPEAEVEGGEPSLFDQPEEEDRPAEEADEEPAEEPSVEEVEEPILEPDADRGEIVVAEAVEPIAEPGPAEELERRLGQLEQRLEELLDEKDRLGRQVAAQTEELRVQRAAIARTQRVLRDLSRPGDQATEPVPKD